MTQKISADNYILIARISLSNRVIFSIDNLLIYYPCKYVMCCLFVINAKIFPRIQLDDKCTYLLCPLFCSVHCMYIHAIST